MLAQNFKTATDLRITDAELSALIKVLGMLERCELKDAGEDLCGDNLFCMSTTGKGCGTPACIGGWVATLIGESNNQAYYVHRHDEQDKPLHDLYWNRKALQATVAQAAQALRSFLTTGDARWDLALA